MAQTKPAKTPGFNIRLRIRFKQDANGRELAHYWSMHAGRWIPIGTERAHGFIDRGEADLTTDDAALEL